MTTESQPKFHKNAPYTAQQHEAATEPIPTSKSIDQGNEKNNKTRLKIVAGLAALAVATGIGVGVGPKIFKSNDRLNLEGEPSISAPVIPGHDNMANPLPATQELAESLTANQIWANEVSTSTFNQFTLEQRANLIAKDVEENRKSTIEVLNTVTTADQQAFLDLESPKPSDKRDYSDSELLNDFTHGILQASLNTSLPAGEKMLSLSIDPNLPVYGEILTYFDTQTPVVSIHQVEEGYRPLSNEEFMGVSFGEDEGRLIKQHQYYDDGRDAPTDFTLFKITTTGDVQTVTEVGSWTETDPSIRTAMVEQGLNSINR